MKRIDFREIIIAFTCKGKRTKGKGEKNKEGKNDKGKEREKKIKRINLAKGRKEERKSWLNFHFLNQN